MLRPWGSRRSYVEDAFEVTCLREALRRRQGTQLADFFSILLVRYLAFLEELIHDRVAHFGVAVVLYGLGVVFHRALAFAADGVELGDAVVGPGVFIVALQCAAE